MRVRFAGSVIVINNKGFVSLVLSLFLLGLILYFLKTIFYNVDDPIVDKEVLSLDAVLNDKQKRNDQHGKDDKIGENGSKQKLDLQNDASNLNRLKRNAVSKVNQNVIKAAKDHQLGSNKSQGKVKMAMDVIPNAARKKMELAAQSMHLPHRPPDKHYNINVTLSDQTSLDRELPDTRPPVCATLHYDISTFPKVSIIIPFFNEAPTMLLRNIHSILNRTPNDLLEEIILGEC